MRLGQTFALGCTAVLLITVAICALVSVRLDAASTGHAVRIAFWNS